jgi:hypothetical protein
MIIERRRPFVEKSPIEAVLLRQKLGFGHYRDCRPRDPEKRRILIELALAKARQVDRYDYEKVGERRRRVNVCRLDEA